MTRLPFSTPAIMGIVNVTPDSFYDGGRFEERESAVTAALTMIKEGADIIDIGGQSALETAPVAEAEELLRIMPMVETLHSDHPEIVMSIDTSKAAVAQKALEYGAVIINDITAGRNDPAMLPLIAAAHGYYVLMHGKDGQSPARIQDVQYDDILKTIHDFFTERIAAAEDAGVKREHIILDPGLGHFISSDPQYSWRVLENLEFLKEFGCPILVSPSRKSFTAEHPDQPPGERLPGTLKATKIALEHGAKIIRTHDVQETKELLGD